MLRSKIALEAQDPGAIDCERTPALESMIWKSN